MTLTTKNEFNKERFQTREFEKFETDVLVLREEDSSKRFGSVPSERPLKVYLKYGFIVLDKPQGPSSHEVAAWVRKMFGQERAGYSGTLDPAVSGILPIGLGDATKALSALLLGPKEYIAVARIHDPVPPDQLNNILSQFLGPIYQKPPQRSSVKRVTRTREIFELEVMERYGNLILLRFLCEAGTYIRKLVYDIGELLIVGATMAELRRTKVCQFTENDLVRIHDLHEAKAVFDESNNDASIRGLVKPIEVALAFLREIRIRDSAVESICQGAQLAIPGIISISKGLTKGEIVRILSGKGELVALAECQLDEEQIRSLDHGIAAITKRVIMQAGTYPRMWKTKEDSRDEKRVMEDILRKSILDKLEEEELEEGQ